MSSKIDINLIHLDSSRLIGLGNETQDYYITAENADIILYTDNGNLKIGTVEWKFIDAVKAREDQVNLFIEMDSIDQTTSELYEIMEKQYGTYMPNFLYISEMIINESYRGKGIGSAVINRLEEIYRGNAKLSVLRPWPITIDENKTGERKTYQLRLQRFYKRLGYYDIGEWFMTKPLIKGSLNADAPKVISLNPNIKIPSIFISIEINPDEIGLIKVIMEDRFEVTEESIKYGDNNDHLIDSLKAIKTFIGILKTMDENFKQSVLLNVVELEYFMCALELSRNISLDDGDNATAKKIEIIHTRILPAYMNYQKLIQKSFLNQTMNERIKRLKGIKRTS